MQQPINRVLNFEQDGDLPGAVAANVEVIRRQPGAASAHDRLGQLLQRLSRIAEAEEHLRRSRSIHRARGDLRDAYADFLGALAERAR